MPKFRKGEPRPPNAGRRRGSRNKIPLAAKEAVLRALNDGAGAVAWLVKLKTSRTASDRAAFAHLVGKLIPREISGELDLGPEAPRVHVYLPDNGRGPTRSETEEKI